MKTTSNRAGVLMLAALMGLGMAACEKQGPLEKVGEEVDEAVDTVKNDGKEPVSAKIDDAVDEARKDIKDATK
jgi:hypothetical protein